MTAESEMEHAVTAAATQTIPVAATPTRYGAVSQTFHWLTAILVGAAFLLGEGGPEARVYVAERASTLNWHETLGILVIVVVVFRLVWRFFDPAPEEPPMPAWMHLCLAARALGALRASLRRAAHRDLRRLVGRPRGHVLWQARSALMARLPTISVTPSPRSTQPSATPSSGSPGCTLPPRFFTTSSCATPC